MTKIHCAEKTKSCWKRMLNASDSVWNNLDKPDGKLVAGKGWKFEIPIDTVKKHLTKNNIDFTVESDIILIK